MNRIYKAHHSLEIALGVYGRLLLATLDRLMHRVIVRQFPNQFTLLMRQVLQFQEVAWVQGKPGAAGQGRVIRLLGCRHLFKAGQHVLSPGVQQGARFVVDAVGDGMVEALDCLLQWAPL